MRKIFTICTVLTVIFTPFLYGFQNTNSDFIIKENGERIYGDIDLGGLKANGIIKFKDQENNSRNYQASEVKSFVLGDSTEYISRNIRYAFENNKFTEKDFFTLIIIDGELSLVEVYGASFGYGLIKEGKTWPLQKLTDSSGKQYKTYQGTFYILTNDCDMSLKTTSIKDNESSFINYVNLYNQCINPDFEEQNTSRIKYKREEIEITVGNNSLSINGKNTLNRNDDYDVKSDPSLKIRYKRNIFNENIYLGFGMTRISFQMELDEFPFTRLTFSEFQFPISLEYRTYSDILGFSFYSGISIHTRIEQIESRSYVSANFGGSASINLSQTAELGLNIEYFERLRDDDFRISSVQSFAIENNVYTGLVLRFKVRDFE